MDLGLKLQDFVVNLVVLVDIEQMEIFVSYLLFLDTFVVQPFLEAFVFILEVAPLEVGHVLEGVA